MAIESPLFDADLRGDGSRFDRRLAVVRCVNVDGSDCRLDYSASNAPLNPRRLRCEVCGFPELEDVPQPYRLNRGRARVPHELAPAQDGNLLLRERAHRTLELAAPGLCGFYPTVLAAKRGANGAVEDSPWVLAVPERSLAIARIKESLERCKSCGEYLTVHTSGWVYGQFGRPAKGEWVIEAEFDLWKQAPYWSIREFGHRRVSRGLWMSVRLLHLLSRAGLKGLLESTCGTPQVPNAEETAWIDQQTVRPNQAGIPVLVSEPSSDAQSRWLRRWLAPHPRNEAWLEALTRAEHEHKVVLPKGYRELISRLGPVTFGASDDITQESIQFLPPDEVGFQEYRAGQVNLDDADGAPPDAVEFARSSFGDSYCFDVTQLGTDYPVVVFRHEMLFFEDYASGIATAVKRFMEEVGKPGRLDDKVVSASPKTTESQGAAHTRSTGEPAPETLARQVLDQLQRRGIPVADQHRARIESSTSLRQLATWLGRAYVVKSAEQIFRN